MESLYLDMLGEPLTRLLTLKFELSSKNYDVLTRTKAKRLNYVNKQSERCETFSTDQ